MCGIKIWIGLQIYWVCITIFAGRPAPECFEEVSIDDSCTFLMEEGVATLCVGPEQTAAAQESVWIIATTVLAAVILAIVAVGAVLMVRKIWP